MMGSSANFLLINSTQMKNSLLSITYSNGREHSSMHHYFKSTRENNYEPTIYIPTVKVTC